MISVIIPVHNEEHNIRQNISIISDTLCSLGYKYEIIIIDDCSDDDTYLNIKESNTIKIFRKVVCQGKGAALKTGWKMATGEYVVFVDADIQISPKEIKTFFKIMDLYDSDVVIGSKRHTYSNVEYSLTRKIVSFGYHLLIKILFDLPLKDTQAGFKLFRKSALDLVMNKILVKQYAFDLEILIALHDNNIRVADAPIYVSLSHNNGSVRLNTILETFKDTLAIFYRRAKGWYKNAK
jgi:glycosyltransferase involved in cell wall biosynthesis